MIVKGRVADRSSAMRHSILLRVVSVRRSRREHDGDRSRDRDTTRRALAHRYRFALNVTWSAYSADQVAGVSAGGYRYYPRDARVFKGTDEMLCATNTWMSQTNTSGEPSTAIR
jgi:hypothetical protein